MALDRIDPARFHQWRNPYHAAALQALEPLRKAIGYEPRNEVIPDQQHVSLATGATWDHRVTVPSGCWLWALSGSSQQPAGYTAQISDLAGGANLFSSPLSWSNITGQGSVSVPDSTGNAQLIKTPLHILPTPRPLLGPVNVQLTNLDSAHANEVQLVLWILQPPPAGTQGNQWNAQLEAEIASWTPDAGSAGSTEMVGAGAMYAPSTADSASVAPSGHALNQGYYLAAPGDNVAIPGLSGFRIGVHQLDLYNVIAQTIRFTDGLGGPDLRGPLTDFDTGQGYFLPFQDQEPHFVLSDGQPLVINLQPGAAGTQGAVSGFIKYRLWKNWSAGGNG